MNVLEELKKNISAKKKADPFLEGGLSTGSTMLNIACSGNHKYGFLPGHFYLYVGDSGSGKTFLTLTSFAEAANSKRFDDYRLIFDCPERGALMNFEKFFGKKMADRLEPPAGSRDNPKYSRTAEEFYYNVDTVVSAGPAIYVLDSMDALVAEDELEKFQKNKRAHASDKEGKGSYGTAKAKLNSSNLRIVHNRLQEHGSILIIISQTRENIGFDAMFNPKTRGGGKALTFYATLEMWTSVKNHIKKTVKGKPRELGVECKVRIKKNRLTGRDRTVDIPIFHSFGIDDLGSCVDFLVEEGHWVESKGKIKAPEFEFEGSIEKLIPIIEQGKAKQLRDLVATVWQGIEEACEVKREPRYS